jgi:cell wall-associated NlpC family hydrolase
MRVLLILLVVLAGCNYGAKYQPLNDTTALTAHADSINQLPVVDSTSAAAERKSDTPNFEPPLAAGHNIITGNTTPAALVAFAKTLIGTPYLYGSTDPSKGFDCSGFITFVFNHFDITVPRSSIDFTNVNKSVPLEQAKPGDLILFTGTDPGSREVGHMGIIVTAGEKMEFIHSPSGKQYSVTITPLEKYYMSRFVKVIRVFPQNDG